MINPIKGLTTMLKPHQSERVPLVDLERLESNWVLPAAGGALGARLGSQLGGKVAPGAVDLLTFGAGFRPVPKTPDVTRALEKLRTKWSPANEAAHLKWQNKDKMFGTGITRGGVGLLGKILGGALGFVGGANAGAWAGDKVQSGNQAIEAILAGNNKKP